LVLACLLAGLRQGGPYPLLAVSGEQGAARPDLADRAIFLSLPHIPVELRGARNPWLAASWRAGYDGSADGGSDGALRPRVARYPR
jgi:hypothetical protein